MTPVLQRPLIMWCRLQTYAAFRSRILFLYRGQQNCLCLPPAISKDIVRKRLLQRFFINSRVLLPSAPSTRTAPSANYAGNPQARVWVNRRFGVYHCRGSRWYGATHLPNGTVLAHARQRNRNRRREFDQSRRGDPHRLIYGTKQWQRTPTAILARDPLCRIQIVCVERVAPAEHWKP